jgi:hypothetical protein
MLMERLFSSGMMTMGPSKADPARQVGVFTEKAIHSIAGVKAKEIELFRWIVGEWSYDNAVPATRVSPAYTDSGKQRFTITEPDGWVCSVSPNGEKHPMITIDAFSRQWIYLLTRGSYGMLRSKEGWMGNRISFVGAMTMIGIDCEWRMTWIKSSDDEFKFVNEERLPGSNVEIEDGSWSYIDEWRFRRIDA